MEALFTSSRYSQRFPGEGWLREQASPIEASSPFMVEALPKASAASRKLAGDLIFTTLSRVVRSFSQSRRTRAEVNAYADAMTNMFGAYLQASRPDGRPQPR